MKRDYFEGADPVKINDTCIGVFGGIQPEILSSFAKGKIQNGFVDRWLFAYPEKVPYPKFNDVDIDERIAANWTKIIQRILSLPFEGTPKVVKLSPGCRKPSTTSCPRASRPAPVWS